MEDPRILGYMLDGSPIWPISGSEDDSDSDETDDEETGDDTEGEETEYTPPTREEWERVTKALERANAEAKKRRLAQRKKPNDKDGDAPDVEKAVAEAESVWRAKTIKFAARGALASAGVDSAKLNKALRLLDTDDLDLNEDDEVEGLEDQIEELKEEFPELFAPKHDAASHGRRVPRVNGASQERQRKELTPTQRQVAMLQGGR